MIRFAMTLGVVFASVFLLLSLTGFGFDNKQQPDIIIYEHRRRTLSSLSNGGDYLDPKSVELRPAIIINNANKNDDIWSMNLQPISTIPNPNTNIKTAVLFWMIPKSGTTTAKNIYKCMGLTLCEGNQLRGCSCRR